MISVVKDSKSFIRRRLQYILFFASVFCFVYLVIFMNTVDLNFVPTTLTAPEDLKRSESTNSQSQKIDQQRNDSEQTSNDKILNLNGTTTTVQYFVPRFLNKIDWHNYEQIAYEKQRVGPGEHGEPVNLPGAPTFWEEEFNENVSNIISVNRSLPDLRHKKCHTRQYLKSLPSVSVIIPFFNERLSTLLRTIYSIINRSPPQLLKEVLVVDDGNNAWDQKDEFYDFVLERLEKVKIIYLPIQSGLMAARSAGIRNATGDVVVVLDAHTEANVNWLPPLLEPIAMNYRTVVVPQLDAIEPTNFFYRGQDNGGRGVIDWRLDHHRLPILPEDKENLPEPYETPVMTGGSFAISRAFFFELGGYDPGLKTWAGEQYELSFKIWQCGGRMLEVPCSRVGHLYRVHGYSAYHAFRNFRRVAEVWMDEYARYVYQRMPNLLNIDPGDLTEQRALRKRLNCKPFRWFLEKVAFEITEQFPLLMSTSNPSS